MQLDSLHALSPVDGRYYAQVADLSPFFSEQGLIHYRLRVEIEYFIALCEIPLPSLKDISKISSEVQTKSHLWVSGDSSSFFSALRNIYHEFNDADAQEIKNLERSTNHDIKALEYFIKLKFDEMGLSSYREFIHFGLTSQDINNTAIPLSLKESMQEVYLPVLNELCMLIKKCADDWKDIPMLAYTHGQPASPTRLGKEFGVFVARIDQQINLFHQIPYAAKFGGATGNLNAHTIAYPQHDWIHFSTRFVSDKLGLYRSHPTTQIEHYDHLAAHFDALKRINTILIDFSRDIWLYIAKGYFKQIIKEGEVGSSAMPHKVNPIDFENAEGNLGIANALFEHFASKLPVSRLQRDLTDSTVLRNIGVPLAHGLISFRSLMKGIKKLVLNSKALEKDLSDNWAVVAEAIQTILRREGYPNPYEKLKDLTRTNQEITEASISSFIDELDVADAIKTELHEINPFNYTGV